MPSRWVTSHAPVPKAANNHALDLACGKGRHSFYLASLGWHVTAIDRDLGDTDQSGQSSISWIEADLECGHWPLGKAQFDLIVVTNYLHRPLFDDLRAVLAPNGMLIYETFMIGNEAYGRPRSPDFLLAPDELADVFSDWDIIAFHQGPIRADDDDDSEIIAVKQSIAVRKPT